MKKIKVVLTGADGFLGTHVVKRLKQENVFLFLFNRKIHDVFQPQSLKPLLHNADVVIHLAGANRDSDYNLIRVNTLGTLGLLEGLVKHSKHAKLVFSSSFQIYDNDGVYGLSKKFAEELIEQYSKKYRFKSIILRISNIYGPGARPFYNSVVATFVYQIKNGKALIINGNGNQKRDYLYVEDVVDAIIKSIHYNPDQEIKHFDICSGKLTSINEIVELVKELSSKKIKVKYNRIPNLAEWQTAKDYKAAKRFLSWKPTTGLSEGLLKVLSYYE